VAAASADFAILNYVNEGQRHVLCDATQGVSRFVNRELEPLKVLSLECPDVPAKFATARDAIEDYWEVHGVSQKSRRPARATPADASAAAGSSLPSGAPAFSRQRRWPASGGTPN
jgi:hypothetical protein